MTPAQKHELLKMLDAIKGKTIIVEGMKDKAALEHFGIKDIITLKKGIFETCQDIPDNKEVIILTDLDIEGRKLYTIIRANLERRGIKADDGFRAFLRKYTPLRHIEGLKSYVDNLDQ
jgi:5S rRNA maturation endonuclease (ribonuclease M5)